MRAGPRGIVSQFTCALATSGTLASKIATAIAVHCVMPPPGALEAYRLSKLIPLFRKFFDAPPSYGREQLYLIVACTVTTDVPEAVGP